MTEREDLLDLLAFTQPEPIEDRIIKLFRELPLARQQAVLDELTQIWDLDVDEEEGDE